MCVWNLSLSIKSLSEPFSCCLIDMFSVELTSTWQGSKAKGPAGERLLKDILGLTPKSPPVRMASVCFLEMAPTEVWADILRRVTGVRSRLRLEAVSRRMNQLAKDFAWTRVYSFKCRIHVRFRAELLELELFLDGERLPTTTPESVAQMIRFFWLQRQFCVQLLLLDIEMPTKKTDRDFVEDNLKIFQCRENTKVRLHLRWDGDLEFKDDWHKIVQFIASMKSSMECLQVDEWIFENFEEDFVELFWKTIGACENLKTFAYYQRDLLAGGLRCDNRRTSELIEIALCGKNLNCLGLELVGLTASQLIRILQGFPRPLRRLELLNSTLDLLPVLVDSSPGLFREMERLSMPYPTSGLPSRCHIISLQQLKQFIFKFAPKLSGITFGPMSSEDMVQMAAFCLERHQTFPTNSLFVIRYTHPWGFSAADFKTGDSGWDDVQVDEEALNTVEQYQKAARKATSPLSISRDYPAPISTVICRFFKGTFQVCIVHETGPFMTHWPDPVTCDSPSCFIID